MKRIISIVMAAIMLLSIGIAAIPANAVGEYDDYEYVIEKCSYDNGQVTIEAKGPNATNAKGIHISFFRINSSGNSGNTRVINKTIGISNTTSLGGGKYRMKGVVENTNLAGGDYQLSFALTDSTGNGGSRINYVSGYKILNTSLAAGNVGGDITVGIINSIISILSGDPPLKKIESDTIIYADPECTVEVQTLHPGANDREPAIYTVFGSDNIQTNTVAIIVGGQTFFTHPDTMSDYSINTAQTVSDNEKQAFVNAANKGITSGHWSVIGQSAALTTSKRIIVNDLETGDYFAMRVVGKGSFLSVEPATKDDTKIIYNLTGKWKRGSRAIWVRVEDKIYPAALDTSLYQPKTTRTDNDLDGYLKIYFSGCTDVRGNSTKSCSNSIIAAQDRGALVGVNQTSHS